MAAPKSSHGPRPESLSEPVVIPPLPPIPASQAAAVRARPDAGAAPPPLPDLPPQVAADIFAVSLQVPPPPPLPVVPPPAVAPEPQPEPEPEPEPEPAPEVPADPESLLAFVDATDPAAAPAAADETDAVPAIRLRGLTKSFGQTLAVDDIDLDIPAGTFYGIVGPNGAGKTTTLSMISGLLVPDAGTIEIAGVDLAGDPDEAKALVGVLPDRFRTFERLTGRQLLHYYGLLRGLRGRVVSDRTDDLARAFDLAGALSRPVSDYSAGMTKKIMLAGALIHAPRVLVLDEPFEAVDPLSSAVILDVLAAYVARGGTVVLSSHGMDFVERVCSGVAVIVAGRVLAHGTVESVRGGGTLAERFVDLVGGFADVEGLEWLHSFSD